MIYAFLEQSPKPQTSYASYTHVIFDGSFVYKRSICIVVLIDAHSGIPILCSYNVKENSGPAMHAFFTALQHQGFQPKSCTTDGNPRVIKVLQQLWPTMRLQRCLVHVQRQGLMWCRIHPKTVMARRLRELFVQILSIRSYEEKDRWYTCFHLWEEQYADALRVQVRGWVMTDLKNAYTMLKNAEPYLFTYLAFPEIPATTNRAEGFFSHVKRAYKRHAGLALRHRASFIRWFTYFQQHPNSTHF